jgi:hypothetical protein
VTPVEQLQSELASLGEHPVVRIPPDQPPYQDGSWVVEVLADGGARITVWERGETSLVGDYDNEQDAADYLRKRLGSSGRVDTYEGPEFDMQAEAAAVLRQVAEVQQRQQGS